MKKKVLIILGVLSLLLVNAAFAGVPDIFGYTIKIDALRNNFDPNATIAIYNGIDNSGNGCYVVTQLTVDNDNNLSAAPTASCLVQNSSGLCPVMCDVNIKLEKPASSDLSQAGKMINSYYDATGGDNGTDNNILILNQDILQKVWNSASYVMIKYGMDDDGNTIVVYEPYDRNGKLLESLGLLADMKPNTGRYPVQ